MSCSKRIHKETAESKNSENKRMVAKGMGKMDEGQ